MDLGRLRIGEWIGALSGAALLAFMFFAWYGSVAGGGPTAWEAFAVIDLVLLANALAAIALGVVTAAQRTAAVPIAMASLSALLAIVATFLVLFRMLVVPDVAPPAPSAVGIDEVGESSPALGLYLGFLACLGITVGALLAIRSEEPGRGSRGDARPVEITELRAPRPEGTSESPEDAPGGSGRAEEGT